MLSAYQKTFVKIKGSIHLTFNTYIHLHIYDIYIYKVWWYTLVFRVLGIWRQRDPWGILTCHASIGYMF